MTIDRARGSFRSLQSAGVWSSCILMVALVADTAVFLRAQEGTIPLASAILLHLQVIGATALTITRVMPDDHTAPIMALCLSVFSGPIGLVSGLGLAFAASHFGVRACVIERWREWADRDSTFDQSVIVAERIESGRALRPSRPARRLFSDVMDGGSFADKQWLLGIVAKKYHASYKHALDAALSDAEPGLRVQAAAVRARLNDRVKAEFKTLMRLASDPSADPVSVTTFAGRTIDCLKSDLLDPSETRRLRAAAIAHCESVAALHGCSPRLEEQIRWLLWSSGHYEAALDWQPNENEQRLI